jgi:tripartite-type tricarboxylate transporter receptor subunit TctC
MKTRVVSLFAGGVTFLVSLLSFPYIIAAQTVDDFYRDKKISIVVGFGPGGGYDVYARLLARHFGQFISPRGSPVVVENMPGAGSLRAANHLFNSAPKDGTVIGTFERGMILLGIIGNNPNIRFNPDQFTWLGSLSNFSDDSYLFYARSDAAVKSVSDMLGPNAVSLKVGGTAPGAAAHDVPILLRDTLGLRIESITGYPDGNAIYLALERGEVEADSKAYSSILSNKNQWLKQDGFIRVLLQFGRATRHPHFPNVPTARELAKDDRSRAMIEMMELPYYLSRPFVAPPDVPKDRAAVLQQAFSKVLNDPRFREEASKLSVDVEGVRADEASRLVSQMSKQPPELAAALAQIIEGKR